jgi:hypothetical protein
VQDTIILRQQQPDWQQPILLSGPVGQNVQIKISDLVLSRQEQPWHPSPALAAGPQGPSVRSPVSDRIAVVQQQPDHPPSLLRAGPPGASVLTKVVDWVRVAQELPWHPLPVVLAGVQGPNVYTRIVDWLRTTQEAPYHPSSSMRASIQGPNVALPGSISSYVARQEQPWHPLPSFLAGVQSSLFVPQVTRSIFVRQEQPWHPISLPQESATPGIFVNRPFVIGRLVTLRTDATTTMPLPYLDQWPPSTPLDSDPYTVNMGPWVAMIPGDVITGVGPTITNQDGSPQTSLYLQQSATDPTGLYYTMWLTGGVAGSNYVVTLGISTSSGRFDRKSIALPIVARRS